MEVGKKAYFKAEVESETASAVVGSMSLTRSEPDIMNKPHPSLYQINTRVWLTELSQKLGRPATLDDIPDAALDSLARMGFDWVWFLSVWQTGPAVTPNGKRSSTRRFRISAKRT